MGSIKGVRRGKYKTRTLHPNGEVQCFHCHKKYRKRSSLLQHIRATHFQLRKKWNICARKFTSTSTLNRHQRKVHGITSKKVALNAFGNFDTFLEFCRGVLFTNKKTNKCQPPFSLYGELLKLKRPTEPNSNHATIAHRVVQFVLQESPHKELHDPSKYEELKRILFNIAYIHANSLLYNAFSEKIMCSKGGAYMRYYIFDVLSRLNHSCDPNMDMYLDDDDATMGIAARSIKAGEQIFINYVGDMPFETQQNQKEYLKETWDFDCQCPKCS